MRFQKGESVKIFRDQIGIVDSFLSEHDEVVYEDNGEHPYLFIYHPIAKTTYFIHRSKVMPINDKILKSVSLSLQEIQLLKSTLSRYERMMLDVEIELLYKKLDDL